MNHALKKLQSKRGSGIAEALIGFLISVLSVLTLFGIVSTTTKLIQDGDVALERFYEEEKTLDLYNVKGTTGFRDDPTLYGTNGKLYGTEVNYKITVGNPTQDPDDDPVPLYGPYFVTSKFHMFAFSVD